jgi:hypothetical protein
MASGSSGRHIHVGESHQFGGSWLVPRGQRYSSDALMKALRSLIINNEYSLQVKSILMSKSLLDPESGDE